MNTTTDNNIELDILEHIQHSESPVHQRDLASIISKSLGMTHSIVKRLTEKGYLKVSKINNRNISYIVTPAGLHELTSRSFRYIKRTIRNVVIFKDAIDFQISLFLDQGPLSQRSIVLVGNSDVDFIIEHLAVKRELDYRQIHDLSDVYYNDLLGRLVFLSEDIDLKIFKTHTDMTANCEFSLISIASIFQNSNENSK